MNKLEIRMESSKEESVRTLSPLRVVFSVVVLLISAAGFVWFSPVEILDNIGNEEAAEIHQQNVAIKKSIKSVRASVDEVILKTEESRAIRDSAIRFGGLGFRLDSIPEGTIPQHINLTKVSASLKQLLDALEKNPMVASNAPINHPLKNGHAIKKRFEVTYDPFTNRDIPHRGIDFVAAEGDTVYATGGGSVMEVRNHRGFGLSVKIDHLKDVRTFYAHLGSVLVKQGDKVKRGQPIAIIGESGQETGIGLHYEVRLDGVPVNPESFFITK